MYSRFYEENQSPFKIRICINTNIVICKKNQHLRYDFVKKIKKDMIWNINF
jgi:hypothetical protein